MGQILIVDDDQMDRVLIRSVLEPLGHTLVYAADGQAGIELCRETDFDLVVTDLAMPELNGLRLIKALREEYFDVPIIAVSGRAMEQLDLAEDYGANLTMYKPLDAQGLLDSVERCLRESRHSTGGGAWGSGR